MNFVTKKLSSTFEHKTVLITGHTGFKGTWLSLWLKLMGAHVIGYSIDIPTSPSLFEEVGLSNKITDIRADILDFKKLFNIVSEYKPDFIFHLAAQPLVRSSYKKPCETFNVNIMGTVYILEAIRCSGISTTCVCITSDKCYENFEWEYAYRENDKLGGYDPYSASKGAAEIIINSYRRSFFNQDIGKNDVALASVRAGNVIGGGDWAEDRIVPDCIRSIKRGDNIILRNPEAIRPWQFVLDPLFGYLWLARKLIEKPKRYSDAWNFGPHFTNSITVRKLADMIIKEWGKSHSISCFSSEGNNFHEANYLKLDITKSLTRLGWNPVYQIEDAVQKTVRGYLNYYSKEKDPYLFALEQIECFMQDASKIMDQSDTLNVKDE